MRAARETRMKALETPYMEWFVRWDGRTSQL